MVDPSIGIVTEELEDQDVTDNFGHIESPNSQIHFDMSQTCSANNNDSDDSGDDSIRVAIGTEDQKLKYAIVKGIFEAIELSTKTGASLSTIADLLCYAGCMYCRGTDIDEDNHRMKCLWPKNWEEAKNYL